MAQKKISELDSLLAAVSGGAIIPIVAGDTTYKVTVEELKLYTDQGLALTSSNIAFEGTNTFSSTQTFNGAVFLNGDVNIVGNVIGGIRNEINELEGYTASLKGQTILSSSAQIAGNISGSFTSLSSSITNRVTAVENSISSDNSLLNIFSSSVNTTTSSLIGITNGLMAFTAALDNTYATDAQLLPILQATASLNTYTSSQNLVNLGISIVTGSLNSQTSSQDLVNLGISIVTGSLNSQTSSQDLVNLGISIVTGSLNQQTGSQDSVNLGISEVTSSLNSYTSSNESWKDGVRGEVNGLEAYTASLKGAIEVNGQDVNVLGMITAQQFNVTYVSSSTLYQSGSTKFGDTSDDKHEFTGSVDVTGGITGSLMATNGVVSSSQQIQNYDVFALNSNLYTITGSLIGITNGLMAFTAALDSTYATDAQVLPILQATASLNEQTGSQNTINFNISVVTSSIDLHILKQATQTGSQDLVNLGISTYTGSQTVINSSVDSHILKQATQTGSQDLVNLGISTFTGSLRSEIDLIEAYTASLKGVAIVSSSNQIPELFTLMQSTASLNTQTGSQDLVNLGISTFTGSIREEINGIEAYTASLKGVAIVSSSQQITNYYKFAETASANTFYGNQTITGSLNVTGSVNIDNVIKLTPVTTATFPSGEAGMLVASSSYGFTNLYLFDGSDWKWLVTGSIA